jgi:hypothetical protein
MRRIGIGVSCALILLVGVYISRPVISLGQQTVLQVCVIQNPGDTCAPTNNNGGNNGNNNNNNNNNNGNGGGGGGNNTPPLAYNPNAGEVYFSGLAYPGSSVTLVRDGQVLAKTTAGQDAQFQFDISNVTAGTYTYGIWSEDSRSVRSVTNSFSVSVAAGVGTVVSGIILPPTIDVDISQVKRGDPVTVLGSSAPNAQVTLLVHSTQELVKSATSDKNGAWKYVLDTLELEYGPHTASARWKNASGISPLSSSVGFEVGNQTVIKQASACGTVTGDINCDNKVNIIDFSVLAYWYKRTLAPAGNKADLNHDGKVDLVDFSILAYHWTG